MTGENLDLSTENGQSADATSPNTGPRRYIGVRFECCDAYLRVYINRAGTAYQGHCPRCSKPVTVRIGPGGTAARFFTVS